MQVILTLLLQNIGMMKASLGVVVLLCAVICLRILVYALPTSLQLFVEGCSHNPVPMTGSIALLYTGW